MGYDFNNIIEDNPEDEVSKEIVDYAKIKTLFSNEVLNELNMEGPYTPKTKSEEESVLLTLFNETLKPEYHLKRGHLDSRSDSRFQLATGAEKILFPGIEEFRQCKNGNDKIIPINENQIILIIPIKKWNKSGKIEVKGISQFMDVILFVDETGSNLFIGGERIENTETFVFRGVYSVNPRNELKLKSPIIEIPLSSHI